MPCPRKRSTNPAGGGEDVIGRATGLSRVYRREPTDDCPSGLFGADGACARIGKAKAARADYRQAPESRHLALDRYDTMGGKLYRRKGAELELIRDFNDMSFEPIRAPYDWREETRPGDDPAPWHPLDGETR